MIRQFRERSKALNCAALALLLVGFAPACPAAEWNDASQLFLSGDFAKCETAVAAAAVSGVWDERWALLQIRCELARGKYRAALASLQSALKKHQASVRLRLLGHDVLRKNGRPREADEMLAEIETLAAQTPWRYGDAANRVALGRAALLKGADARDVLELFYDRAKQDQPKFIEAYLAGGELALQKHDYAVAAEAFEQAKKIDSVDPRVHYGLARAYRSSRPRDAKLALAAALKKNPRHVDSLLIQADEFIDSEQYADAERLLEKALDINPLKSHAWAYRALLAHLKGDRRGEQLFREAALRRWRTNPAVDHLIGRKLSQKYRFAEGSTYQRRALKLDPNFLPAQAQLCQDLLRLGQEKEGWRLAAEVFRRDGYNVLAYNLVTLREGLEKFRTLEDGDFILRMEAREAEIYGQRVLKLLQRAKKTLCKKYRLELTDPVVVEIFPRQEDFAIRTFGIPGGAGYLGVCFGRVITANSPASQGENPSNWQAVLWHEFAHVVTLTKTRNKMPRWLSEGISVYEERQENPAWGQTMNAHYRRLVLGGQLTPVSGLSGAFLNPKSSLHVQFAYYQSSLVVEYLVLRYGSRVLDWIMMDLAEDIPINQALSRHTGSLADFEKDFAAYARKLAEALPPEGELAAIQAEADALLEADKWREAAVPLRQLIKLYPGNIGGDNPYTKLAKAYRELGERAKEAESLEKLATLDDDEINAPLRLMELARSEGEWKTVAKNANRVLAVNPLLPEPHRQLARATEQLGELDEAIAAYRTVLLMDPPNLAETHYRLARLLARNGKPDAARRHVLKALEEAPRYRAAQRLLLELVRNNHASRPRPVSREAATGCSLGREPQERTAPRVGIAAKRRQDGIAAGLALPNRVSRSFRRFAADARGGLRFPGARAPGYILPPLRGYSLAQIRPGRADNMPIQFVQLPLPATDSTPHRRGVPDWKNDPQFADDVFTFVRVKYNSPTYSEAWATDYPDSDLNFSYRLQQLTSLKVDPKGKVLELTSPKLRDYPFIYLIEPGEMSLTDREVTALRGYLLRGGFLMVDDFWGEDEWRNLQRELKRVFPNRQPKELPLDHPIFHCVYDLKEKPQIPALGIARWNRGTKITWEREDAKTPHYKALFDDDGRMMAIICHNTDLGDGWEREGEDEWYFREFSEKKAYPMGINIVFYAMTH